MIRKITLFFILCFALKANSQIPKLESNVPNEQKGKSLLYKTFLNKYDLAISYQPVSWTAGDIQVLALKKKRWEKITISFSKNDPTNMVIKKKSFPSKRASQLIADLTLQNFWTLSNDSLNMTVIPRKTLIKNHQIKDTVVIIGPYKTETSFVVADGIAYLFEILQGNSLRRYAVNNPETYIKYFPI
ncbi:MAG: hypothetical protein EOP00_28925 [Pedobacter sp.]|nr:MAG: hypothetical protein EOP00_28925 [Pedobacter sp.]